MAGVHITTMLVICVAAANCSPIKRTANSHVLDGANTGGNTAVDVNLPQNVTSAIINSLPVIPTMLTESIQRLSELTSVMSNIENVLEEQLIVLRQQLPEPEPRPTPLPPTDCQNLALEGVSESGVYEITPQDGLGSFEVYCDMETDSGGWTVFQKRYDGSVDFYRVWDEYVAGFGELGREHWLGLEKIRRFTDSRSMQIRFDLEDFNGNTAWALYDSFDLGDAQSNYTLQLDVYSYSGTAGDEFSRHDGYQFSTKDRENDVDDRRHCAQHYEGAWWYHQCYSSNLNGRYVAAPGDTNDGKGLVWPSFTGDWVSAKSTEMKMRPI